MAKTARMTKTAKIAKTGLERANSDNPLALFKNKGQGRASCDFYNFSSATTQFTGKEYSMIYKTIGCAAF